MDAVLQVRLLGSFQLHWCGRFLAGFKAARLQVLLAYVLLHRQAPIERSKLAFLLWPDSTEAQAQTNLRRELHNLREALPGADRFVDSAGRTLHWRADAPATVDLIDFETCLSAASAAEARRDAIAARTSLEQAMVAYGGDLLPARYEDFALSERERLRNKCLGALEQLAELCVTGRDYPGAIRWTEEILRLEPLRESTCRKLMQLHERGGNRGAALQVYRALAERLQRELQAAPDPASEALFRSILARSAPTPPSRKEGSPHIPLIGRTAEWEQLHEAWRRARAKPSRMVLLRGDAGVGKTRLAEEMLTWATSRGIPAARSRCYAAEGSLNYGPVVEWLDAPELRRDWERLDAIWLGELSRLFPELPTGDWHPKLLHEAWQRHRFFEAMARALVAGDRRLLLIDDLQWCDAGTTEWLHFLLRFKSDATLLLVATLRDTDLDPAHLVQTLIAELRVADQLTEIAMVPLNATDTAALASAVAERSLSNAEAAALYEQTQGWPLFVVETMRAASLGNFALARKHLEDALAACAPEPSPLHLSLYAQDPAVICGSRLAYTLWFLGLTKSASAEAQRAISRARTIGHPFSLAYALNFAAWLADYQGNSLQARTLASELAVIAYDNELGHLRPMSRILLGYFDALEGSADSIARIEEGIRAYLTTEQKLYHPYALALLARAQARLGLSTLATLDEALAAANRTGEQFYSAELLRLKGECLLPLRSDAAELFSQSTALARSQSAPILELRALMSLERLVPSPKTRKRIASLLAHPPEQPDAPDRARAETILK
ncbi:MAG: AAA family ATPase [Terrimicrobiaceae bacterium]